VEELQIIDSDTHLTAFFHDNLGKLAPERLNHSGFQWSKRLWGWQWHQLDHMQIIGTSLQTDNCTSTLSLNFLQAGCSIWCLTNSVKALKARIQLLAIFVS